MKSNLPIPWRAILTRGISFLVLFLLLFNLFLSPPHTTQAGEYLYIYALDVGQSEAILVTTGGKTMLIDSGSAVYSAELFYGLARYGIERLDMLVLTHPHEDHIGNARLLLQRLQVDRVLLPPIASDDLAWQLLLQAAGERTETLYMGDSFSLGHAFFEVLLTDEPGSNGDLNESSLILRGVFGEQVFLFMDDAGEKTERALLTQYGRDVLDCDYLKVGHHGSGSATTMEFLLATTPAAVSISCGRANSFGFPHPRVLADLETLGVHIARTDLDGTVVFGTDGKELRRISNEEGGLGQ
ncbi:MAG: MBL fold metallo-hydrolase [Clostridia bacterium]|nr:MBL fold metallo-hydrolase [Clostridia bacterium]